MTTSVNVSTVVVANTFDQWRIQTNLLKDDVNEIARGDFTKPTGNVTFTVGRLILANSTGTMLDVTADARISGKISIKNFEQDGGAAYLYTDSADIKFRAANGAFYANGNTYTRFLYNNTYVSGVNANMTGFIETTGTYANGNVIMNVANVLVVRSVANSSNVYITGNIQVSNVATIGNARITLANVTTLNASTLALSTANVNTLNVNSGAGSTANIANANIANLFTASANTGTLRVSGQSNIALANITTLEVNSLTVAQPISAPSESDSSSYRLRVSQTTRGVGTFGVFQGTTNGNAAIQFTTTGNVWQITANDLQSYATVLSTANIGSTYTADTANVASLTLVKGANDNAAAAFAAANSAANGVRVSANTGSTIAAASGINFSNTSTIQVTVGAGNSGNANVAFSVIGGLVQGTTGAQGTTGPQGTSGTNGAQGTTGTQGTAGVLGGDGAQGATGTQGTTGTAGSQGTTGIQGTTGTRGYNGGTVHSFNSGQTADADPGNGVFVFNNATIGSVTYIYIDQLDYLGVDRSNYYLSFDDNNSSTNRGLISFMSSGTGTDAVTFRVTGTVTAGTGYYKIPVAWVSGSLPTNGAVMSLIFTYTGAQGPTGSTGGTGSQGATGSNGNNGSQGATGATGSQGTTGTTGTQGATGTNGSQGATGTQGATGSGGLSGSGTSGYLTLWNGSTSLTSGPQYSGGAIYASDFIISSDLRLKNIYGPIYDATEKLSKITGIRYTWNQNAYDAGETSFDIQLGVIAQDVQTVFPESVVTKDNGYLAVKYERLVPVLIQAIKELSERVRQLELEI